MATIPGSTPSSGPGEVGIQISKVSRTGTVTLANGEEYSFSIYGVTPQGNWDTVAKQVAEFFRKSIQDKPFEEAKIVLTGDLTGVDPNTIQDKNVKITTAEVKYKESEQATEIKEKTFSKEQDVAFRNLSTLVGEFIGVNPTTTPISSSSPPATTTPATRDELVDQRITICQGREHTIVKDNANTNDKPYANFALADQLIQLNRPGLTNYSTKNKDEVAAETKTDVKNNIESILKKNDSHEIMFKTLKNAKQNDASLYSTSLRACNIEVEKMDRILSQEWNKVRRIQNGTIKTLYDQYSDSKKTQWLNENSNDIIDSLQKANRHDNAILRAALPNDYGNISNLINQPSTSLNEEQKITLANSYLKYIEQAESKFVGPVFFRAFVEKHQSLDCNDFFQVVVIEEKNGTKTAKSYPSSDTTLDSPRCVFLHFDENTGVYSSYKREQTSLTNLNTPVQIKSQPAVTKVSTGAIRTPARAPQNPIQAQVTTIEVNATGQCLDTSIAYQILKKRNPDIDPLANRDNLNGLAQYLRDDVKRLILEDAIDTDEQFTRLLVESIRNIPAEIEFPREINEILSGEKHITAPGANLSEIARAKEVRKALRVFYADYITKITKDNMRNSLDAAFLHVLPRVNLAGYPSVDLSASFAGGLNLAVVQGDKIVSNFPGNSVLDVNQALFVNYNGIGHYQAVDMSNVDGTKNKVSKMIALSLLKELVDSDELRSNLQVANPSTDMSNFRVADQSKQRKREIIADLIFKHDKLQYGASRQGLEPGTGGDYKVQNHQYGNGNYGLYRIDQQGSEDLKNTLNAIITEINEGKLQP